MSRGLLRNIPICWPSAVQRPVGELVGLQVVVLSWVLLLSHSSTFDNLGNGTWNNCQLLVGGKFSPFTLFAFGHHVAGADRHDVCSVFSKECRRNLWAADFFNNRSVMLPLQYVRAFLHSRRSCHISFGTHAQQGSHGK